MTNSLIITNGTICRIIPSIFLQNISDNIHTHTQWYDALIVCMWSIHTQNDRKCIFLFWGNFFFRMMRNYTIGNFIFLCWGFSMLQLATARISKILWILLYFVRYSYKCHIRDKLTQKCHIWRMTPSWFSSILWRQVCRNILIRSTLCAFVYIHTHTRSFGGNKKLLA